MHQSIKERLVQQAQIDLLQTSFQAAIASSPLNTLDDLESQAEIKLFSISRAIKLKNNS